MKNSKYLLLSLVLVFLFSVSSVEAACCKRITWGLIDLPKGEVFNVSNINECYETCYPRNSNYADNCQNFYLEKAATDVANYTCVAASTGCCEIKIHGSPRAAYWANSQDECNFFCSMRPNCNSLYITDHMPNKDYSLCIAGKLSGASVTSSTPPTTKSVPIYQFTTPTDPLKYAGYSPSKVVAKVISVALLILGSIALLMFIFAGFMWMTDMGDGSRIKTARKTLIYSTVGLILIFLSYIVVGFLLDTASLL